MDLIPDNLTEQQRFLKLLEKNLGDQAWREEILRNPETNTRSGRPVKNPIKSRAVLESAYRPMPLPGGVEGKTVARASELQAASKIESEILRAAAALNAPTGMHGPDLPTRPTVRPVPAAPNTLPTLLFLELLLRSGGLNSNEDSELERLRPSLPLNKMDKQ